MRIALGQWVPYYAPRAVPVYAFGDIIEGLIPDIVRGGLSYWQLREQEEIAEERRRQAEIEAQMRREIEAARLREQQAAAAAGGGFPILPVAAAGGAAALLLLLT